MFETKSHHVALAVLELLMEIRQARNLPLPLECWNPSGVPTIPSGDFLHLTFTSRLREEMLTFLSGPELNLMYQCS